MLIFCLTLMNYREIENERFSLYVEHKLMILIDFEKASQGEILNISKDVEQKLMISSVHFGIEI